MWQRLKWPSGPRVGLHPRLSCEKSLAEAGDVSFSTGGSHDALSGAARNIVINLGT